MTLPTIRFEGVRLPLTHFDLELDLAIHGRVAAVFGPSGAGKTSLLDVLAGLRKVKEGRVRIGGHLVNDGPARLHVSPEERRIGYVPQEGALFPHLSVRGNLLYGRRRDGDKASPIAGPTLESVVEVLEVRALLERRSVLALSGGERQRVALARALLSGPELLLLDEPLAGLDTGLKDRILPYLQRVRDEFRLPMLLVTHSATEVMALCDEAVIIGRGRVLRQGPPGELFVKTDEPVWIPRADA